jgi:hypothetical protein
MNLFERIEEMLRADRQRIVGAIEALEEMRASTLPYGDSVRRRGRKSMGAVERQEVSERLKRYWAQRRNGGAQESDPSPERGPIAAD